MTAPCHDYKIVVLMTVHHLKANSIIRLCSKNILCKRKAAELLEVPGGFPRRPGIVISKIVVWRSCSDRPKCCRQVPRRAPSREAPRPIAGLATQLRKGFAERPP